MSQTTIEKTAFKGWPNCYRVSNPVIEFIATTDIGPRIIFLGFKGERNLFHVFDETAGQSGGDTWRNYGGHRLWHAPEDKARTYQPDNAPVEVTKIENGVCLIPKLENRTGIQKVLEVTLAPRHAQVRVVHRLKNTNLWPVELARWGLSVMAPGGFAIAPLNQSRHPDLLLPNRPLTLWPYTDMRDERYLWGKDFVLLRQKVMSDIGRTKFGLHNQEGWAAYAFDSFLFIKRFQFVPAARYPDFDSSLEVFTNSKMLELESLGPLQMLQSGQEVTYEETWELHKGVMVEFSEDSVKATVLPLVLAGGH